MAQSGPFFMAINMNTIYGFKSAQTQRFNSSGKRIPVTLVKINPNVINEIKQKERDGYKAVQIVIAEKLLESKPISEVRKIKGVKVYREIKLEEGDNPSVGETVNPQNVLKPGDLVNVRGISKGKGFAGVVKRHHFAGGPKTHGQSDRHRGPGSIGQTTTPGRVFKGKRMAGHMGATYVTTRNLVIMEVGDNYVIIRGTIPGNIRGLAEINKIGESKNFLPLMGKEGLDKQAIAAEQALLESQAQAEEETKEEVKE